MIATSLRPAARRLDGARQRLTARRELARLRERLPELLARADLPPAERAVRAARWTRSGTAVLMLGAADALPSVVLKATRHAGAAASLRRQHATLTRLHAIDALGEWRALLPRPLTSGVLDDVTYVVETALPGAPATTSLRAGVIDHAMRAVRQLHDATATVVAVGDAEVERWVVEPCARVAASHGLSARQRAALAELEARLAADLLGQLRRVAWIHGDYWAANVLLDGRAQPCGIVDWDRAAPVELPLHDALHLTLFTRTLTRRQPLGVIVAEQLRNGAAGWSASERATVENGAGQPEALDDAGALLLYWLRHVGENVRRDAGYAHNAEWLRGNVAPVLDAAERRS